MNAVVEGQKYRLLKKHHRAGVTEGGKPTTERLEAGTIFIPTPAELIALKGRIEPVSDDTPVGAAPLPAVPDQVVGSIEARVAIDLQKNMTEITSVIRKADSDYLAALFTAECQRKPIPRKKVLEQIERRRKASKSAHDHKETLPGSQGSNGAEE